MIKNFSNLNLIVALDHQLRMRKDKDRIFIFPLNPFTYHEKNQRFFIPSIDAIIIALFDGKKSIDTVVHDTAFLFDISLSSANQIIFNFLSKYKNIFIQVTKENTELINHYNPMEFIVPSKKTDLLYKYPKLPEVIMFIPTLMCYFKCKYCYAPKNKVPLLSLELISRFIKQIHDWGIPTLFFSGGDFFAYPYYKYLIEMCYNYKIIPIIPTKTILSDSDIDLLQKNKISEIQLSIDSINDQVVNSLISSPPGYLNDILFLIKKLINRGIKVNTNTVITSYNILFIPDLIEKLTELGVKHITLSPYARSLFHHHDSIFCSINNYLWLNEQISRLNGKLSNITISYKYIKDHSFMDKQEKNKFYSTRPECMGGKNGLIILPDGKVTICEILYFEKNLILGDLKLQSLSDIWFSEYRQRLISQSDTFLASGACINCSDKNDCYRKKGKCYVRALQAFDDVRMPDPYCPYSSGGKRIL